MATIMLTLSEVQPFNRIDMCHERNTKIRPTHVENVSAACSICSFLTQVLGVSRFTTRRSTGSGENDHQRTPHWLGGHPKSGIGWNSDIWRMRCIHFLHADTPRVAMMAAEANECLFSDALTKLMISMQPITSTSFTVHLAAMRSVLGLVNFLFLT